jgi:protein-disulfide isomerase
MMKKVFRFLPGSVVLVLFAVQLALAQPGDDVTTLRQEVERLKDAQTQLREELEQIKVLLRRMTSPARDVDNLVFDLTGHPARGAASARLILVEFSDFECPYCGRHFRETQPQIDREYVQTGKVRYVFRNFPLEAIHKEAFKAAEAALCAGEQQKFWEMHDRLFTHQDALAPKELPGHAAALGLDVNRFEQCVFGGKYGAAVRQDLAEGQKAGVRGTPAFFFAVVGPDGSRAKAVKLLPGAYPFSAFKETLDGLLAGKD